jgi:alpha-1,4-digalacturonate transport system substrate-binding protein
MKKVLSLLLVAAMALMLVACGGSSSSTPAASGSTAASGSAEAPTGQTLKVMLSEEPSSGDSFTTTLNKWAEETGNSVELMVIPYDDQLTKFPLMAKNKDLPDLVSTTRLSRLYPDEFVDLGQVVRHLDLRADGTGDHQQEYNSDKLSCLPLQFTITNVFYNKALSRPGLEVPLWTTAGRWMKCTRPLRS